MFAAYSGDVSALRRFALSSMDMDQKDYDARTALHIAAAEGHVDVVKFLTNTCKVDPFTKDRWGNQPIDDAMQFGHEDVVAVLKEYQEDCSLHSEPESSHKMNAIEDMVWQINLKNLDVSNQRADDTKENPTGSNADSTSSSVATNPTFIDYFPNKWTW